MELVEKMKNEKEKQLLETIKVAQKLLEKNPNLTLVEAMEEAKKSLTK